MDIGAKAGIKSGVWIVSTNRTIQAMKIDAAGIGHMKINVRVLAALILGKPQTKNERLKDEKVRGIKENRADVLASS